jgi:hypothetical protein
LRMLLWKAQSMCLDLRYGGILRGTVATAHKEIGAHDVVNVAYRILPYVFKDRIKPSDVLVDVGSGKGRVLNWWLSRGYRNRMIGIELNPQVAEACRKRLRKHKNVTVITGEVCASIPEDGTLFYLFNPFSPEAMARFRNRLFELFGSQGSILVLYYNPLFVDVFATDPNWSVEVLDLGCPSYFTQTRSYRMLAVIRLAKAQSPAAAALNPVS